MNDQPSVGFSPDTSRSTQLVLGWNLQPNSSVALRFAVSLADRLDAHLHVVHVADFNDLPIDPDSPDWEAQLDHQLDEDEATARTVLDQLDVHWTYHPARGRPSDVIADLAERVDAMMIIIGGPRGGMMSFLETIAGQSVSHQLTRPHGRPVLVVPESHSRQV